jgi:AraC-like DNA-binding protein
MAKLDLQDLVRWRQAALLSGWHAAVLARELDVSRRQLQRYTRAVFHCSPQKWLNEQRLILAGERLKGLRSVKVVAYELGYKQLSHFSRQFKHFHHVAPTAFLARLGCKAQD